PTQLKQQMATLLVEKAVLEKELEIIKKDVSVIPGQLSNKHKTGLLRVWLTSSLFRWGGAGKDIDHAEVVFRAVQS
ncbi:hypothetical protein I4J45_14110, partial [Corynebacterium belfantii]|nr:hypothetical protein [Corynebacterium belfantii]MBG9267109.1 hypothetical protein [Corynebacterium belfantii]